MATFSFGGKKGHLRTEYDTLNTRLHCTNCRSIQTIRVYFLDGTYKAVVINPDTTAALLHEAVASKIELSNDTNMGLFDQRKKGGNNFLNPLVHCTWP